MKIVRGTVNIYNNLVDIFKLVAKQMLYFLDYFVLINSNG